MNSSMSRSTPEDDEVAALVVDADVEISHAALELLGKSQILRGGVPRHLYAAAVVRTGDGEIGDDRVVVDVLHPFREIAVGLHGILDYDLIAHRDDGRKDDDQNGDQA